MNTKKPVPGAAKKDAVFQASIEFIGTLTGMKPPPIEVAPPETFEPFRAFTERVCEIFATQQEPALNLSGLRDAVLNALNDELAHGAYDCTRAWEAWSVGTMSEDDFSPVSYRMEDIASSVVNAISGIAKAARGSAHTPGSWTALQTGEVVDENGHQVAHVFEFKNLRVIAAAPDLLSELRKMRRAYVSLLEGGRDRILELGGDCDPVDVMEASNPSLLSADAAIAIATGATP